MFLCFVEFLPELGNPGRPNAGQLSDLLVGEGGALVAEDSHHGAPLLLGAPNNRL